MRTLTGRQPHPVITRAAAQGQPGPVIDIFALGLTHGLIALALWRLVWRDDLDGEMAAKPPPQGGVGRDA